MTLLLASGANPLGHVLDQSSGFSEKFGTDVKLSVVSLIVGALIALVWLLYSASRIRIGRSRTVPAATRNGPTVAGQPGCAVPLPHQFIDDRQPRWARKATSTNSPASISTTSLGTMTRQFASASDASRCDDPPGASPIASTR